MPPPKPVPLPAARAFRIEQAKDLLDGPMAEGAIGDYRLENDQLVVIVDALGRPGGFQKSGGQIRDLAPRDGRDELRGMFLYLGDQFERKVLYTRANLLTRDGRAELKLAGRDEQESAVALETTYRLEPGSSAVVLETRVINHSDRALDYSLGDGIYWGNTEHFAPTLGTRFLGEQHLPWIAGIGDAASYVYATASGQPLSRHSSAWANINTCVLRIEPGAASLCTRYVLVGRRPDLASAFSQLWKIRGAPVGWIAGEIVDALSRQGVANARVHLSSADGKPLASAISENSGLYEIALPPGPYRLSVSAPGRSGPEDGSVQVVAGQKTRFDAALSEAAELVYDLVNKKTGAAISGKLTIFGQAPTPDPRLGPPHRASGANHVLLTATGKGTVALAAGRYRIVASRGPEWSVAQQELEVVAGRSTKAHFELSHVVPTPGYVAADLHQHAFRSTDSAVTHEDRVAANLAEGVEVAVATDHEAISDYALAIERLGVKNQLLAISGEEATTHSLGHFNAFPLTYRPELPDGGAVRSEGHSVPEIVGLLRQDPACKVVQVNHPRIPRVGYFAVSQYEPEAQALPHGFVTSFDAMEVANGKRIDTLDATLRDWYSLLGRGIRMTATGNSDTHYISRDEVGYPRNYVGVGEDNPATLSVDDFVQGIRERRDVVVSTGPFIRLRGAGKPPGSSVRSSGGLDLDVEVWAAPWVDVNSLELLVNGQVTQKIVVPPSTEALRLRWHGRLPLTRDAFVVVIARGSKALNPVVDGQLLPFALTNPVWVDADGKRGWTAPGVEK